MSTMLDDVGVEVRDPAGRGSASWGTPRTEARARLRVNEPVVKSTWLRALAASRATGVTPDGHEVRFEQDGRMEPLDPSVDLPSTVEAITTSFGARIKVVRWGGSGGSMFDDHVDVQSIARRWCPRLPLAPGEIHVRRASEAALVGCPVVDLGPYSIGVRTPDSVPAGRIELEVELDGQVARGSATVVGSGGRGGVCLHLGEARNLVRAAYVKRRFPTLVGRADIPRAQIEELARGCGFLDLRPNMAIPERWSTLRLPPELGWDAAFPDESGRPVGLMSATRTGRRAWLVHQLLSDRKHPRIYEGIFALHDFMMTYPRVMGGKDARIMCYFDRHKSRNEIYYDSFERLVDNPELVGTVPLQRFERDDGSPLAPEPGAGGRAALRVCASEDELALFGLIRQTVPGLHADALEVFPGSFNLDSVDGSFDDHGLSRGRRTFVLADPSGVIACAVCEFGSSELSMFGLFNICHLYRKPGADVDERDERRLLDAVRRFYLQRGVTDPVITAPPDCFPNLREPGTRLVETMAWYVWHPDVLPQYENFYRFRFGSHRYVRPRN